MYSSSLNILFSRFTPAAVWTDVRLKMDWHRSILRAVCQEKRMTKQEIKKEEETEKINLIF